MPARARGSGQTDTEHGDAGKLLAVVLSHKVARQDAGDHRSRQRWRRTAAHRTGARERGKKCPKGPLAHPECVGEVKEGWGGWKVVSTCSTCGGHWLAGGGKERAARSIPGVPLRFLGWGGRLQRTGAGGHLQSARDGP